MAQVRKQFLSIDFSSESSVAVIRDEITRMQRKLEGVQTGGDSFCYWMLYHFEMQKSVARNFVVVREGEFPLYDVRMRIVDMKTQVEINKQWGEINAPADFLIGEWVLSPSAYYRVFFHARNGSWHQDLQLLRSTSAGCWLAATHVVGNRGEIRFEHTDNEFVREFGKPIWQA